MATWDDDRKVIDAATPGPWFVTQIHQEDRHDLSNLFGAWFRLAGGRTNQQAVNDAAFIARARSRWSAALDEIARLNKELSTIRAETTDALNDNYVSRNLVEHINNEVTAALQGEPNAD